MLTVLTFIPTRSHHDNAVWSLLVLLLLPALIPFNSPLSLLWKCCPNLLLRQLCYLPNPRAHQSGEIGQWYLHLFPVSFMCCSCFCSCFCSCVLCHSPASIVLSSSSLWLLCRFSDACQWAQSPTGWPPSSGTPQSASSSSPSLPSSFRHFRSLLSSSSASSWVFTIYIMILFIVWLCEDVNLHLI